MDGGVFYGRGGADYVETMNGGKFVGGKGNVSLGVGGGVGDHSDTN